MKHSKYLLLLSILCSIVLFINCGNSDDPVTNNDTNITNEDNTSDDSTDDSTNEVSSNILTLNSNIDISKSWTQEPTGYTYSIDIHIPTEEMPSDGFPVCILLHGNGGNGLDEIDHWSTVLTTHVLVAPTGYMNSWNLCNEDSNAADIEMVDTLANLLQEYTNINPNKIRILGNSNGAGLANSIFIENLNSGIDIVCAIVTHLTVPQYHLENFYKIGNDTDPSDDYCGYEDLAATPLTSRKYLNISNDNDGIIPYLGGASPVGMDFLNAQDAIYVIAKSQGYDGNKLPDSGTPIGNPVVFEYSYLSGDVVHIRGEAYHGINPTQRDYVKTFLKE
jgi:poly(3-hydroxybutyrate) depolymerase